MFQDLPKLNSCSLLFDLMVFPLETDHKLVNLASFSRWMRGRILIDTWMESITQFNTLTRFVDKFN